jgi:hypothetical protein
MRNARRILDRNPERKRLLERLGVDRGMKLKYIYK